MEFVMFMANLAWKILVVAFAWNAFKWITRNGKGTLEDLFATLSIALKAGGHAIRKKLYSYLKKEAGEEDSGEIKVEATVK